MKRPDEFVQLSTRVLQPRLPCLGYLKIGGKGQQRKSGSKVWYLPTKYDHFKVTTRARGTGENFNVDRVVHDIIGNEPRELDIRLLYNEVHENFQTSLQAYENKRLRCKGDGERAYDRVLNQEIPCTCPLLRQHEGDYPKDIARPAGVSCKPNGILSVFLEAAQTYGGFHVFKTTSWETISGITAFLTHAKQQFGLLSYVPFKLQIYPRTVVYEEGGQQKSSLSYSVAIVLRASMDTAFQIAATAREKQASALQLTSGSYTPARHAEYLREIEDQDQKDVAEEFYPDGTVVDAEVIIEEEVDPLEPMIRAAMADAGIDRVTINKKLAKYSDRLAELATHVEENYPEHWARAKAKAAEADHEMIDDSARNDGGMGAVDGVSGASTATGDLPVDASADPCVTETKQPAALSGSELLNLFGDQ